MKKDFDVKENLKPHVSVKSDLSVADARARLVEAGGEFLLVTVTANEPPEEQPASVLSEELLVKLSETQGQQLSELLETLPPLLVVEGDTLEYEDLFDVLSVLARTRAAGFVALSEDGSVGFVPRSAVERVLPRDEVAFAGSERGEMRTSARTYICRKCKPARRKRPRAGGAPPCDVWSHGVMQEE